MCTMIQVVPKLNFWENKWERLPEQVYLIRQVTQLLLNKTTSALEAVTW